MLAGCLLRQTAEAQSVDYMQGQKLFAQGNYKAALAAFTKAQKEYSTDGNVYYYMGVCYYRLRDINNAKDCYSKAIKYGRSQPPGKAALKALLPIDPDLARRSIPNGVQGLLDMLPGGAAGAQTSAQSTVTMHNTSTPSTRPQASTTTYVASSSGPSSDLASLPREARLYFDGEPDQNGMVYVKANVNGRPIRMLFDTGAAVVLLGKNHLKELGIPGPSGPATGYVMGVGGSHVPSWNMNVDLKVGSIERRNFKITVQDSLEHPLLGQPFYKDFQYQIDKQGKQIALIRNDSYARTSTTASNYYDVPFTRKSGLVVVDVQINGKRAPMIFDTGCTQTTFLPQHLGAFNLEVPADAQTSGSQGIGGVTKTRLFPVGRVRLGPVEKSNFPISVAETGAFEYPLLGQDFFGDWRYSIDNANNVIKFHSRSSQ